MFKIFVRNSKRLAVFIPGIIIAYVSFQYTLPFLDRRVPDPVGILVTYVLAAYVLIPAIIRIYRIIVPAKHLPLYCVTPDGFACDPLNVGLVCSRRQIIEAMQKAGWHLADHYSIRNLFRHGGSAIFGWSYDSAPVSNLFLFGRKQDLAFEIPLEGTSARRHHVRFWATTFTEESKPLNARSIHWHHRKTHVQGDKLLWVGSASLDTGIVPIRHNMQITHSVHPDTNSERELIINGLKEHNLVDKTSEVKLDNPYRLVNRTWRGELHTDGIMKVAWLKNFRFID
jgi:hypothetical protein